MTPILLTASVKHGEALRFYRDVMGFALVDDNPFSFEFDAAGTMLRVQKVESFVPHPFTAVGWRVEDIAAARDRLADRGAVFLRFEFMEQNERGIWTAPGGARVCWFKDPDGNTLSLTQWDG
ncbi:VOC family protein [Qipengyuania sp. ASV99]|uniref:VOC family protein n=1 Tax=Qipengyuania sp. ASV99 TaxID=3399681 RepID=UPI003A4C802B